MANNKFRGDINRFIAKSNAAMDLYAKKVVIDLQARVIEKTPVDKGQLHWNWFIGNNAINLHTESHEGDGKGAAASRNAQVVEGIKINGQIIYITNSLPYAYRIEYEGWSNKAPAGMVGVTIAEMNSVLNKSASEVRGKYL